MDGGPASVRAQKGDRRICAALLSNRHQPGRLLARCSIPYVFSSISARFRIETQSVGPISTQSGTSSAASQLGPLDANSGHSPTEKRTGQSDPKRAFPVSPGTDPKRHRAALLKQLDMRQPERLCTVVDENEMNVVGRQAIGSRPPDGACGVGSAGDSDKVRRRPRRRTASRQISTGHFRPRDSPSAAAIREQKQWSSIASRWPNRQYGI